MFPPVPNSSEELRGLELAEMCAVDTDDALKDADACLSAAAHGMHDGVKGSMLLPLVRLLAEVSHGLHAEVGPAIGCSVQAHVSCALAVVAAIRQYELGAASECVKPLNRLYLGNDK